MKKKSYTGFVVGLVCYLVALLSIAFIPKTDEQIVMRLTMLLTTWYMAWISFHVWRTERIYWYNGTSYEDAEAAGSERRKVFAWKHFQRFGMFALCQTVLSCGMYLLGWSAWIDFAIGAVGLVVTACSTIPIKL